MGLFDKDRMITADRALRGRDTAIRISGQHHVNGNPMVPPLPADMQEAVFALGCFWGAERVFWKIPGVYSTAVGYAGGFTPNPTYEEVCSGSTGHTEAVRVYFDPAKVTYAALLKVFWGSHDPTQGMRQGNDRGTQYRSAIYTLSEEQGLQVEASRTEAQKRLDEAGAGIITTEIAPLADFYYAEEYHQQYLAKNPQGYCGIRGLPCLI
ncbi:peptide-methionine (S)-S-oxide reductase MsrA [Pseudohongiella sp.]|uniref:peptide-methionine (S)-S-oxide reductase n=1 Tax=marine sediment metagenome TaxID=412755 RepID=A0A0F9Z3W5_9ZZZZ|nr:peptide-methionine (S)-S-oxide reductase MsrA [Pseudohongiella sp.]HDZ08968.1 peptide-methionine (S)-S-oxide reductase MsrA [Pseudohongiella sp.]HEA62653.1 peptide-methionine (S)-S-oxide reductase MsrA [Pseudohongiella sp.]